MRSWRQSPRWTPGAWVAPLLAVSSLAFAEDLVEPLLDDSARVPVPGSSAGLLTPPPSLPGVIPPSLAPGSGTHAAARPLFTQESLRFSSTLGPGDLTDHRQGGFSVRLMSRMTREAQRFRREQVSDVRGILRNGPDEDPDSLTAARRTAEASRVITRSIHRVLDEELDRLVRTSLGLGPTIDFLQNLSLRRLRAGGAGRADEAGGRRPSTPSAERPDGLRGDIGLRLDAHPALFFRARFRGLHGRIELPARDEPIRLSLESPVRRRGRAVLSAGLPRDGQGWAALTFNIGF